MRVSPQDLAGSPIQFAVNDVSAAVRPNRTVNRSASLPVQVTTDRAFWLSQTAAGEEMVAVAGGAARSFVGKAGSFWSSVPDAESVG